MSHDQQVALTRQNPIRGESTHLSRAARQVVPPFLQKLYEIVNDPQNEELIRWSENGESFYVLNHERFAREVLGRWFKHQKFTSFVRQLNMYGFHKIPHLQQGVLKSDTDTEPWNFEHPHFHRGQPDLLCLIQRKKPPTNSNTDDGDVADVASAPSPHTAAPGQILDLNTIVNGITSIKRHQQAISADLNALKKSNELLWEEATLARQRHDKHQDTINRILKFLAGVFGHSTDTLHHKTDSSRSSSSTPRPRQRLMIGDGTISKGKTVEVADVSDDDGGGGGGGGIPHSREGASTPLAGLISSVETPSASPVPPTAPSTPFSSGTVDGTASEHVGRSMRPAEVLSRANTNNTSNIGSTTDAPARIATTPSMSHPETTVSPPTLSPFMSNTSGSSLPDSTWQTAIQQVLNNPQQMQRLMQIFAAQQNFSIPPPSESTFLAENQQPSVQLAPFTPAPYEYARYRQELPVATQVPPSTLPLLSQSIPAHDDGQLLEPLLDNASRLQKSYRDALEIEADMDVLQSSLHSLINDLGMDPQALLSQNQEREVQSRQNGVPMVSGMGSMHAEASGANQSGIGMNGLPIDPPLLTGYDGHHDEPSSDLFLESLLNGMGDSHVDYDVTDRFDPSTRIDGTAVGDASTEQLTSFLDEVSDAASPMPHSPGLGPTPQKRKSDVAGLSIPQLKSVDQAQAGPKTKRKR